MIPLLAAQLRGLVYWPNDNPTWNPLLYRLANRHLLPLPVYSFPVDPTRPLIVSAATYHAENLAPSMVRRAPAEVVMDLEEYMTSVVQTERTTRGEERLSVGETLAATANSLGAAHYDESIALDVDLLRAQVYLETNFLHRVIVGLSRTTAALSRYVLQRYR